MSFKDMIKDSVLENYIGTNWGAKDIAIDLIVATIIAIYIFLVYRSITKKTFYSKTFNISLVALTIIITSIIITIQSNLIISLGMVGALSIIRFRTAIKDPMDLTFLFWSISVGIICGADIPAIAIIESLLLTSIILILNYLPNPQPAMLLIINTENIFDNEKILTSILKFTKYYKVKSRNISNNKQEMIIELRIKEKNDLVQEISKLEGVTSVSLISHDGEAII